MKERNVVVLCLFCNLFCGRELTPQYVYYLLLPKCFDLSTAIDAGHNSSGTTVTAK